MSPTTTIPAAAPATPIDASAAQVGGAAKATLRWSLPDDIDPNGSLQSVSCPTLTFCVAVGGDGKNGIAISYANGTWTTPAIVQNAENVDGFTMQEQLQSVSCATPTFCVAVGGDGSSGIAVTYSAGRWGPPLKLDQTGANRELISVSCASATSCVAFDTEELLTYNSGAWSGATKIGITDSGSGSGEVSCVTGTNCTLVHNGDVSISSNGRWGGPDNLLGTGDLDAVSCPTSTFCAAVGDSDFVVMYSNGRWGKPISLTGAPAPSVAGLLSVSCPSSSFCVALDESDIAAYANGAWQKPVAVPVGNSFHGTNRLVSVSCASSAFCIAVTDGGYALKYGTAG